MFHTQERCFLLIKYDICSTYQQLGRTAIFTFQNKTKAQSGSAGLGLRVKLYKIMTSVCDDICPSLLTLNARRQIQIAHTESMLLTVAPMRFMQTEGPLLCS